MLAFAFTQPWLPAYTFFQLQKNMPRICQYCIGKTTDVLNAIMIPVHYILGISTFWKVVLIRNQAVLSHKYKSAIDNVFHFSWILRGV